MTDETDRKTGGDGLVYQRWGSKRRSEKSAFDNGADSSKTVSNKKRDRK
jgi:hypothetical protein